MLDLLQWPAMLVTVLAAWCVASSQSSRRILGFWLYLLSNVLWVFWGWHSQAWALVVLQACLAVMNCRGLHRNQDDEGSAQRDLTLRAPVTPR